MKQILRTHVAMFVSTLAFLLQSQISHALAQTIDFPTEEPLHVIESKKIDRAASLRTFFKSLNSPLEPYSEHFVEVADKYGLDYRLLPAISCNESSCGKYYIPSSNNVFGWGIYGNKVTSFESIEVGIDTVGKGLAENYVAKGYDTVEEIAPIYTPPNPQGWASKIRYFYGKMDVALFEQNDPQTALNTTDLQ